MRKKFALVVALAIFALFTGSAYSGILYANQYSMINTGYGYSISGELEKWVTTSQSDFECSGPDNRENIDTASSPGNVTLEKSPAWKPWWNLSWQYRMLINVTDVSNSNLVDYPVVILLTPGTFNYGKANVDGDDIRFTLYNHSTGTESELSYWIEEWNTSGVSKVWVNVTNIPASGTSTLYMYYGNTLAGNGSNGTATFTFFDDFEHSIPWVADGMWHTTTKKHAGGNHSEWYGQEATDNYDTGTANSGSLISPEFQVSGNEILELWFWREVENLGWNGYDRTVIYDSTDNSTWNQIWYNDSGDASGSTWKFLSVPMTSNAEYIKFYFDTVDEYYNNYWGWFIDNVRVRKHVSPEPTVNMGAEESQRTWMDYFGGTAGFSSSHNVTISNGDVILAGGSIITYDFQGVTNPSSTHVARYDADDDNLEPATAFNTTGTEFSNKNYERIYASDNSRVRSATTSNGYKAQHIFRFKLGVAESEILKLNVSWEGRSQYRQGGSWHGFTMSGGVRIWNHSSDSWEVVGDSPSSEATVSKEYISNIGNYVDGNYIFLMAYAEYDNRRARILTDYVKLDLTLEYSGNVTSIPINPSNLADWDKFYADDSGAGITYKILDGGSGNVLCIINSSQANSGYDISPYTSGVGSIKLYAELTSNSSTPVLHDWGVSWHSGYYRNGYLISCPYDTGSPANYSTISWNAYLPAGTSIKFQIASSDGTNWTEFLGPDGTNSTYYTVSNTNIWNGHTGDRYIKYIAYFETSNASLSPVLRDVTITYGG